ncbi:hypothetical protein BLNAU_2421 [Blattamonas nauphoetae]|uniref:Uncharacterized protein n=1 Tax=Blattamonas nauphoetae TaxID=2049346 RepID=A0ABQ9YFW9_9EUKA|nr:hypothetical protein BLNAU_2421 [Blattamonas nauphoetae]
MAAVLYYFSRDCFSTPIPLQSFIDKLDIPRSNFLQSLRHIRTILPIPPKSIPIETYLSQIIMVLPIDHPSSFLKMTEFLLVLLDDIVDGKNPTIMASAVSLHSFRMHRTKPKFIPRDVLLKKQTHANRVHLNTLSPGLSQTDLKIVGFEKSRPNKPFSVFDRAGGISNRFGDRKGFWAREEMGHGSVDRLLDPAAIFA